MMSIIFTWLLIGLNLACVALWGAVAVGGEVTDAGVVLSVLLMLVQGASAVNIWSKRA
jgi:hypothetical protein